MSLLIGGIASHAESGVNLVIPSFTMEVNEEKTVSVELNNPGEQFCNFQTDLYLPEGIEIVKEDGWELIDLVYDRLTKKSRTEWSHTLDTESQPDGALRILVYSGANTNFKNESGAVAEITVKATKAGLYNIDMKNIYMGRDNSTSFHAEDYTCSVLVGSTDETALKLQGDFTLESLEDWSLALNENETITSIDLTETLDVAEGTLTTGNPNTLVYVAEGSQLANENNVVVNGNIENMVITDGHHFGVPKAFTAGSVSYTRTLGNTGWYSICLPFAASIPENVSVEKYVSLDVEAREVEFAPTTSMAANNPYIFKAEAGDVTFTGSNVVIPATPKMPCDRDFIGVYRHMSPGELTGMFALRPNGTGFGICSETAYSKPFRAFLNTKADVSSLSVRHLMDGYSGIENQERSGLRVMVRKHTLILSTEESVRAKIVTIDGKVIKERKLLAGESYSVQVAPGIYVINGLKYVVK